MSTVEVTPVPETSPADFSPTGTLSREQKDSFNSGTREIVAPKEASAPSKESSDRAGPDKPAAASEPAKPQERKKTQTAEERKLQLQKEIQELVEKKRSLEAPKEDVKPTPVPAAEKKDLKPRLDDKKEDGTPKWKSVSEWEDARDAWIKQDAIDTFKATEKTESEKRDREQKNKVFVDSYNERLKAARAEHADYDEVAFDKENPIHKQITAESVIEGFIMTRPHGPQVLYHLAKNPDEVTRILAAGNAYDQTAELLKIESTFSKPAKEEKKEAPVPVTQAKKPVSEVGGRASASEDSLVSAALSANGKLTREFKDESTRRYAARNRA